MTVSNALMDIQSPNGSRKRRYYLAGDDDLESIAASQHALSSRVGYHQLYPENEISAPLPVLPPISSFFSPVPAVEEHCEGRVSPEGLNKGNNMERKDIGLGRVLKALASEVCESVKGNLKAIWQRGITRKGKQQRSRHFKVTEEELAELGVNDEEYQRVAQQVYEEMGFQLPQGLVVIDVPEDEEEDGDYIDDGDNASSSESIFTV